jgi:hypothetical protein
MEEIKNQVDRNRLRWFGHVKKIHEHRIPKGLLEMKMSGKRSSGRPCTLWKVQAKHFTAYYFPTTFLK